MRVIRTIAVHHSASAFGDVATIRGWHKARGWQDIGYHAVVLNGYRRAGVFDPALVGVVEPGRAEDRNGAHVLNHNADSLGICFVGNYDQGLPPPKALAAGAKQVAAWCRAYGVESSEVFGHREYSGHHSNHCPGTQFPLDLFRGMVHTLLVSTTEETVRAVVRIGAVEIPYHMEGGSAVASVRAMAEALGVTVDTTGWPVIVVKPGAPVGARSGGNA